MRHAGQMFPVKEDGVGVHWSEFFFLGSCCLSGKQFKVLSDVGPWGQREPEAKKAWG